MLLQTPFPLILSKWEIINLSKNEVLILIIIVILLRLVMQILN